MARVNQLSSSARQQAYMFLLPDEYKGSYDASVFTGDVIEVRLFLLCVLPAGVDLVGWIHGSSVSRRLAPPTPPQYQIPKKGDVLFVMEIKCGGNTIRIGRTYEQFTSLHNHLKQILKKAGHEDKLPMLPPTSLFKSKSPSFLDKRLAGLQTWFVKVFSITDPDISTIHEVREFAQLDAQLSKQE